MEIIRGLYNWQAHHHGCVATIGNFDGVHLGHQAIFRQLSTLALDHQLPSTVITFEPLPHEVFDPAAREQRLQTFRDRVTGIQASGIDRLLIIRFDQAFARQSAQTFIETVLFDTLGVRHLLVGDDFRFGQDRHGSIKTLQAAERESVFSVSSTTTVKHLQERVSSTRVRTLLQQNDCAAVEQLLGRPYRITGHVVHGEKIGRQLGFPTANVALKKHRPLLRGVFAVEAANADGQMWPAVANLGERPTVGGRRLLLEVHLLDQYKDLYGQLLAVDFRAFIRGEMRFDSLPELQAAIATDAESARGFFQTIIS